MWVSEPGGGDAVRIGTTEREDAMRVLGDHFAEGRLPMHEYEERVNATINATTRGDLRELFTDLPAPYPPFLAPPTWQAPPMMPPPQMNPMWRPPPPPMVPMYPAYGQPPGAYSDKSRVVAGLLQILLPFGVGRFYTGHHGIAVAQLLTCGGFGVWSLIDGIIILVNGGTDGYGRQLRD